jgi:hypothetical protein
MNARKQINAEVMNKSVSIQKVVINAIEWSVHQVIKEIKLMRGNSFQFYFILNATILT